jgi:hypothetical protein
LLYLLIVVSVVSFAPAEQDPLIKIKNSLQRIFYLVPMAVEFQAGLVNGLALVQAANV